MLSASASVGVSASASVGVRVTPFDAEFGFEIPQNVSEVDVKESAGLG